MYHVLWELVQQALAVSDRRARDGARPHAHPGRGHRAGRRVPAVRARAGGGVRAGGVRRQRRDGRADRGRGPARGVDRVRGRAARPAARAGRGDRRRRLPAWPPWATRPSSSRRARRTAPGPRSSPRTPPPARTACASCSTRPTAATATRSPTARTAGRGSRSSPACPYDRAATTMAPFPMCADCAREYADPADRRFHAQPVCCPACGPRLRFGATGPGHAAPRAERARPDPIRRGRRAAGRAPSSPSRASAATTSPPSPPTSPRSGRCARASTGRTSRSPSSPPTSPPPDALAEIDAVEEQALTSRRAPIVLLRRRPGAPLASSVAPGNRYVGVLLPYTPLHHLLAARGRRADRADQRERLRRADRLPRRRRRRARLDRRRRAHPRPGDPHPRRRLGRPGGARPRAADPPLPRLRPRAARPGRTRPPSGAGLRRRAQEHVLPGPRAARVPRRTTSGTWRTPRRCARSPRASRTTGGCSTSSPPWSPTTCTRSTCRRSTRWSWPGSELVGVQHHHAHLASCLADNGEAGPVDRAGLRRPGLRHGRRAVGRRGHGGLADRLPAPRPPARRCRCRAGRPRSASRGGWRRRGCVRPASTAPTSPVARRNPGWATVGRLLDSRVGRPGDDQRRPAVRRRGGAGRGARRRQLRGPGGDRAGAGGGARSRARRLPGASRTAALLHGSDLVGGVVDDLRAGVDVPVIAARFHAGLADLLARAAADACATTGLDTVALSGGVFQNVLLLRLLVAELETAGLRVLTHSRVPPNDAGVSLGQVALIAARVPRRPRRPAHPRRCRRLCCNRPRHCRALRRGVPERAAAAPAHR